MGVGVPNRIQQILAQATPDPGFQPVQPGQAVSLEWIMCKRPKSGSGLSLFARGALDSVGRLADCGGR